MHALGAGRCSSEARDVMRVWARTVRPEGQEARSRAATLAAVMCALKPSASQLGKGVNHSI